MKYIMLVVLCCAVQPLYAEYPVTRPPRQAPVPVEATYTVHPDKPKQVITGIGFEIQSDSIRSRNNGMSEEKTSVPHDLTPAECERFCNEMLKGFRYCRLAGGLYWRGTDPDGKYLQPRWPEQLTVVLSNRSFSEHTFKVDTGLENVTFKGYRYMPDEAGVNFIGTDAGILTGGTITPKLGDLTWEFWEQQ